MNNKARGEIAEAQILAKLVKLQVPVSLPFGNNQRYDMVIEVNNKLFKVQCKTGRLSNNGSIGFNVASMNGSYRTRKTYHGQIDIFIVYNFELDSIYCVPIELCGKSTFTLRVDEYVKYHPNINWAKDYTFEKWLEKQAAIV